MTRRVMLENFDLAAPQASNAPAVAPEAVEAARLQGYDEGYKTAWDDAIRKTREDGDRIGAEFARNLRDLGFTYEEARAHVLKSFEGLLTELSETFLPAVMSEAIGPVILEALGDLADEAAGAPVLIRVSPGEGDRLRGFLTAETTLPVQIVDEPSLADGQAYLKLGAEERRVDLAEPLLRVREAIRAMGAATERTLDDRRSA
ncbi:MAG: flagellar biosynthesis protein [Paracoccaceae bacterium]|nr:flagellar biosynthesis protein [Paracoccaceae bacterium]